MIPDSNPSSQYIRLGFFLFLSSHTLLSYRFQLRPGRVIESDKLAADVRKLTMDTVDKCGKRVTVGDEAGIKLTETQKALQAVAADTKLLMASWRRMMLMLMQSATKLIFCNSLKEYFHLQYV